MEKMKLGSGKNGRHVMIKEADFLLFHWKKTMMVQNVKQHIGKHFFLPCHQLIFNQQFKNV